MIVTAILPEGQQWCAHTTVGDERLFTYWPEKPTVEQVVAYHEAQLARQAAEAEAERLRLEQEAAAAALLGQEFGDWTVTGVEPGGSLTVRLVPSIARVELHASEAELGSFASLMGKKVGKLTGQERKALKDMIDRLKPKDVAHGRD